jgi:hypothetical protein
MEKALVSAWDSDPVLIGREHRLWFRRGLNPVSTGRYDYAYRSRDSNRVLIVDDKTGRLEVSPAEVNDQLRELAAVFYQNALGGVEEITVAVCQPWVSRTPSVAVFDRLEAEFAILQLQKNLAQVAEPYAIRTPGPHCKYCPAAAHCEENRTLVNSVLSLSDRIRKGDFALPIGKYGTLFLDKALMAQKVLEAIIAKYKELLTTEATAVPGYYLKAGYTRHIITDPGRVYDVLELDLDDFLKCGKFSISDLTNELAKRWETSQGAARARLLDLCHDYITETQNEPSLAKESPRRGKPKELTQPELI